ncbi:MAG: hypothetical protein MHPDNHAH_02821 [Anaerolineales bacterium]|nr:hypothetical protein [Anaerolineales bacterium]
MTNYTAKQMQFEDAPDLPKEAKLPHDLELAGCPWLDQYVEFSDKWSPRSFDGYHEAIGLWILSTVAARRVSFPLGGERYTNLYILLAGRTSLYAKTTAVKIAKDFLSEVNLSYLLLPDEITPQRMLVEMASKLPENWESLSVAQKDKVKKSLAFAGQKGWFHDEFGQNLQNMQRKEGPYSEFRSILRKMDDTGQTYEKATIGRGREVIHRPYLALLGALTPADLANTAYKGSNLWGDGYLARMGLVVPPNGLFKDGRFPAGKREFSTNLTELIWQWHERLGIPTVNISNGQLLPPDDFKSSVLELAFPVSNAYYAYDMALGNLLRQMVTHDFDGNYSRFPEKAIRIAALFASLDESPAIQMRHWAKAQAIVERWRSNLHSLYKQVNEDEFKPQQWTLDQKVMKAIKEKGAPTAREIRQYTGIENSRVNQILDSLKESHRVIAEDAGKTTRYRLLPSDGQGENSKLPPGLSADQCFNECDEQSYESQDTSFDEEQEEYVM